ncbi:hypothetical protein SAMN05216466_12218 [Paraburkholderia phenazinium]|uniref:Uncharacterized protein n=1 Tax=Paraburkholderia phenazinium TaxID=60549 RepID=A0A1G8K9J4_9BURK|nr:hypothetical protein [Paraburkholderia phenazinium]SDI39490.1 hypothetical protein SAMN05216466_12218 [Paraburkholderia phenazinium]
MGAIKHAFEHLGHDIGDVAKDVGKGLETAGKDIAKVGKGIAEGVETVGKTLGKDALDTAEATLQSADALIHGHLQQALNKALQAGDDVVKTGSDLGSAGTEATLDSLGDMHLSKKLDNAVGKVNKAFNGVRNDVTKSVDQVASQVVSGTEGAIKGTVDAVNDAAHGKWGAAAGALGGATMDALNVASDLTPEGAAAAIGTQALMNAHIGNAQIDSAIGGALHGNVTQMAKGVVKNVAETEVGDKVQQGLSDVAAKVMPQGGGSSEDTALAAAGLGIAAGALGDGLGSSGSKHSHGESAGGSSYSFAAFGRSGKSSAHAGKAEGRESKEAKHEKKEDADDNAQDAANNTANNASSTALAQAGGGDTQLEQELMLENFLMQAGMGSGGGAQKRRAELSADS